MKTIKQFALVFLSVNVFIIILGLIWGGENFILNTQIAFFSAIFIVVGTFIGYYRNIKSRVDTQSNNINQRDTIDNIEDPYDLYDDDFKINDKQDFTTEEIKEIINEEKKKFKTNSFKNTISSLSSFASVYRIVGYVLLVVGFFYLRNNDILNIYGFLVGISVVPIGTLILNLKLDKFSVKS
ncbi:hypothetical protein [Arcobacter sp. FWKO B]|uniref:hypothetical protein n=1 Tax=Arcobacter sp. FWKO B TaxID=2593672 RepID=UPI0018A4B282|nr:hypothetical protein [Arcobacter sp. FWKO B]QOG11483.1 hypothetical protein FWKOB_01705 [Arcobacter sp. FWKO B]